MTSAQSISVGSLGSAALFTAREPTVPGWVSALVERCIEGPVERNALADFAVTDAGAAALVTARVADADALDGAALREATRAVYGGILQCVESLRARHPVRFWNFIPGIHGPVGAGLDRYMAFNSGRFTALVSQR